MKKLLFFAALFIAMHGFSQTKKGKPNTAKPDVEMAIYKQALKYGDVGAAINNLYIMIVRYPDSVCYKDSLAQLYFQVGSYNQCLRVGEDILKVKPNDTTTLRMMAISHQSVGMATEAIAEFDKVIKLTGNVYDIYQKAALEYRIKRLQESKISVEMVIAKVKDDQKITLYIDQENKQEVPLKAAAFNLYGMIAKDFSDTASARFLFEKAIEIFPEFYFANANLKTLKEAGNKKEEAPMKGNENSPGDKRK